MRKKRSTKSEISNLEHHIGYWLRLVSNQVSHSFAQKLEQSGVTVAEWVILRKMFETEEGTSPSKVAEITGLTRGAVSKLIDRLLAKKLVTREEAAGDRRFQNICLTKEAVSLVPELALLADENDEKFFFVLSAKERQELMKILKKIANENKIKQIPVE